MILSQGVVTPSRSVHFYLPGLSRPYLYTGWLLIGIRILIANNLPDKPDSIT